MENLNIETIGYIVGIIYTLAVYFLPPKIANKVNVIANILKKAEATKAGLSSKVEEVKSEFATR